MTYKESYEGYETCKELMEEVVRDIGIAMLMNPDRLKPIKKACEEVVNEKFPDFVSYSNGVLNEKLNNA